LFVKLLVGGTENSFLSKLLLLQTFYKSNESVHHLVTRVGSGGLVFKELALMRIRIY